MKWIMQLTEGFCTKEVCSCKVRGISMGYVFWSPPLWILSAIPPKLGMRCKMRPCQFWEGLNKYSMTFMKQSSYCSPEWKFFLLQNTTFDSSWVWDLKYLWDLSCWTVAQPQIFSTLYLYFSSSVLEFILPYKRHLKISILSMQFTGLHLIAKQRHRDLRRAIHPNCPRCLDFT